MQVMLRTSVRAIVATIIVVGVLVTSVLVYIISEKIILDSYTTIERNDIVQSLQQARDAFENHMVGMQVKLKDWAVWDDSYNFASHPTSSSFIADTLRKNNIPTLLGLDILIYVDSHGKVLYTQVADSTGTSHRVLSEVPTHLLSHKNILTPGDAKIENIVHGITLLPEGPLLVVSSPILPTDANGPSAGTLIFGKFVDAGLVDKISELTHLSVRNFPYDTPSQKDVADARAQLSKENTYIVQPLSRDVVAGYTALYDMDNQPAFIVRVDKTREIYGQGRSTFFLFVGFTIAALLLFGLTTVFFLEFYVISRLAKLSGEVLDIGATHNLIARVKESTNDEVGTLARAINNMLTDLSNAHTKEADLRVREKEASEQLKDRMGKIEEMNHVMTERELEMVQLKKTIAQLQKRLGRSG